MKQKSFWVGALILALALLIGALAGVVLPTAAHAQGCEYRLGFKAIHDQIPNIVGACKTDEKYDERGNSLQETANGLMEWRKADNFTAFTDGYRTWVNGPCGIEQRLNTQRFPWEANPEGLTVVSSRCGAAPAVQVAPAPQAPAQSPVVTSDADTETITEGNYKVTAVRRLSPPPAQLTGDVSKRVDEATVQLVVLTPNTIAIGTGTVVGADGRTILTAFHVVGDNDTGKINSPMVIAVGPYLDYTLRAKVVAADAENDLALLHVEDKQGFNGFTHLALTDSDATQLGQPLYVYSYPGRREGGLARSTGGLVMALANTGGSRLTLFTEAQASPGSSGGVVVNAQGDVVGIITLGVKLVHGIDRPGLPTITQLTGFVPINLAKPLLAQVGQ